MNKTTLAIAAFFVGLISVYLLQSLIAYLWSLSGITWGGENLPMEQDQQVAMLVTTGISGILGPLIALLSSRHYRLQILAGFFVIGMGLDLYAAAFPLRELPLWFRTALVAIIPLQLGLAYFLAGRIQPEEKKIKQ